MSGDASALLRRATAAKKAGDLEEAIGLLLSAYALMASGHAEHPVSTYLRYPLYLHAAGHRSEAYAAFRTLYWHGHPNETPPGDDGLHRQAAVLDKLRLTLQRDGQAAGAAVYGVLSALAREAALCLQGRRDEMSRAWLEAAAAGLVDRTERSGALDVLVAAIRQHHGRLPVFDINVIEANISEALGGIAAVWLCDRCGRGVGVAARFCRWCGAGSVPPPTPPFTAGDSR